VLPLLGCASPAADPGERPAASVHAVVVDRIGTDRPEWQRLAHRLRRQLIRELTASGSFDDVGKAEPAQGGFGLVRVEGHIEAVDPGTDVLAIVTGDFGWGGAAMRARFRIIDGRGRPDFLFTETIGASQPLAEATWIGTLFSPHFDPLYGDDLADAMAVAVAEAIAAWVARPALSVGADGGQ
jgi:hypothetical protein